MTQLLLKLCVAAALIGVPTASFAQVDEEETTTGTSGGEITIQILSIGGENQNSVGSIFFGLEACQDNAEVEFRLDNVSERESFDIYVGSSCNTAAARDREGDDCNLVQGDIAITVTQDVRIKLGVRDIIESANDNTEGCGSSSSKPKLWFLAVDVSGTTEAVEATDYGWRELNVDTDPPEAPTKIKGGSGENQIPIEWSVGTEEVDSFEIYVDSGGSGGPVSDAATPPPEDDMDGGSDGEPGQSNDECGTGALIAGAAADTVNGFFAKAEGSATATSTNLSSSHIDGDTAAVAVVAIDEAGNKSTLSEVVCVYVVPTTGFKDLYEQEHGEIPQGCPCAAAGPAQLEGALPIALALTVLAYRRRRRS